MGERVAAIHQPNYIPWIGYFHKIYQSDVFVFLDDVEYTSGSWINRNRIKTPDGWTWLTVPVRDSNGPISAARIARQEDWRSEHWKSLEHNYGATPYFEEWRALFEDTYETEWTRLYPLNRHLIESMCKRVGLDCEFVEASTFDVSVDASERLAVLCDRVGADTYLCGMGADDYMDESHFEQRGVSVVYQSFEHPTYEQRFGEFVPELSFVDVILNIGEDDARSMLSSL